MNKISDLFNSSVHHLLRLRDDQAVGKSVRKGVRARRKAAAVDNQAVRFGIAIGTKKLIADVFCLYQILKAYQLFKAAKTVSSKYAFSNNIKHRIETFPF